MIIRITVNDKDFTEILENFADVMFDKLYFGSGKKMDFETCKTINEIQRILNPNVTTSVTKEQSVILRGVVFLDWCDYVDALPETDFMTNDTRDYLKKNFEVSVGYEFTDRFENGETVYYFTTNQKWISQ